MREMEGNKLIVEFLGGKYVGKDRLGGFDYDMFDLPASFPCLNQEPDIFGMKRTGYLGFHESWDWLMPVVEQINENPQEIELSIEARGAFLVFDQHVKKWLTDKYPLIECVWLAALEAINWYNSQNLKP